MSADRTELLENLAAYGRSGSFSLLESIIYSLPDVFRNGKSCKIPHETSVSVLNQSIHVLKNSNNSKRKSSAWKILYFMCDRKFNSLSSELLTVVDTTNILRFMAPSVASLSAESGSEASSCFHFILCFASSYEHRQVVLGETEGLTEAVLHALDQHFILAHETLKALLLRALLAVVSTGNLASAEKFVRNGGFHIVNIVFGHIHRLGLMLKATGATTFGSIESGLLNTCLGALYAMFRACASMDATVTDVPRSMYSYDPAHLVRTNSDLHEFFTVSKDPEFVQSTLVLIEYYLSFVEKVHPEHLEFVLLYRGKKLSPTTYSGVPMIIHAVLISRDPQFKHFADTVQAVVLKYSNRFSTVDRMIYENLARESVVVSPSGPVPNVCALPGCTVSSINYRNMMKKCGRCRAVYYCAEDHQKKHWKEHKLVCVPKNETSTMHTRKNNAYDMVNNNVRYSLGDAI